MDNNNRKNNNAGRSSKGRGYPFRGQHPIGGGPSSPPKRQEKKKLADNDRCTPVWNSIGFTTGNNPRPPVHTTGFARVITDHSRDLPGNTSLASGSSKQDQNVQQMSKLSIGGSDGSSRGKKAPKKAKRKIRYMEDIRKEDDVYYMTYDDMFILLKTWGEDINEITDYYQAVIDLWKAIRDPDEEKPPTDDDDNVFNPFIDDSSDEFDDDEDEDVDVKLCRICASSLTDTVAMPCRHLGTCDFCHKQCSHCPICGKLVKEWLRVYNS